MVETTGKRKRYLPRDLVKASVWVRPELMEECRDAVSYISGHGEQGFSFVRLLDGALTREVKRLARKHRRGTPFPQRTGELTRGARRAE
jgi:hypothetical protein